MTTTAQTPFVQSTPASMLAMGRSYRERLLRIADVCFLTGLGRSTVYAKVKERQFPQPVKLHGTSVAWKETEVNAWINGRPSADVSDGLEPAAPAALATPAKRAGQRTRKGA